MLLPRFLTALIGAPLLLLSIWWGQLPFFILIFGMIMLALHEYYTLAEEARWPVSKQWGLACGAVLLLSIVLFGTRLDWSGGGGHDALLSAKETFVPAAVLSLLFMAVLFNTFAGARREQAFLNLAVTWLGLFYVVWTLSHLFLIRNLRPGGDLYTYFLFIVIWVLDIGAYLGGRRFGKNKMAEAISPQKTWEGAAIGSGSALVAAFLCRWIFLRTLTVQQALGLGLLIVALAQAGDLSESLFKRNAQVKDSGRLLPGHGGILDRFDSFLLAAPAFYYALVLAVLK